MKLFRLASLLMSASLFAGIAVAQPASGNLRIYAVDVEGGQATLFVSPGGQSLLVDTGWDGFNGRDAGRIAAAAREAGLSRIDTVLLTHYHEDHAGGVPQLTQHIAVGAFLDHGELYLADKEPPTFHADYMKLIATGKYKRASPRAGDKLPIAGFDAVAISSDGAVLPKALQGAGQPNPLCAKAPKVAEDTTENGHSLGILIRFAGLKILDAGDLTADRERLLACPHNLIGHVDLLIVSHHGVDLSSSSVFVHALRPRVAIMDNGDHKGASTSVIDTFRSSPGLEALYQLHMAPPAGAKQPAGTVQGGPEHNVPQDFIANTPGVDGKRIDVTVHPDGGMDVLNGRTGATEHFTRR